MIIKNNKQKKIVQKTATPISGLLIFLILFQKLIQQGINTLNLAIIIPATFVLSYFIYKITCCATKNSKHI